MAEIQIIRFNEDQYLWSIDLYNELELADANYKKNVTAWFEKEFLFQDQHEIKKPVRLYDYFSEADLMKTGTRDPRSISQIIGSPAYSYHGMKIQVPTKKPGRKKENYLIRLEFAKLIALDSNSKFKKQFVQWLLSLEARVENFQLLSQSMLLGLMEMVKLCSYIDNQIEYYKTHKTIYFQDKEADDSWTEFDLWRNSILKIMNDAQLNEAYITLKGIKPKTSFTKIEKQAIVDSLQSIRTALFDFLAQQIRPYTSRNLMRARELSDFIKKMFEAAGITKIDIKPKGYAQNGQLDFFRQIHDVDLKLISKTIKELQSEVAIA